MTPLYWRELRDADLTKVTLVDVRTADEYALGHIDGALNIPLDDLRERIGEIPSDRPVYVYCGVGLRGYLASNILKENGYGDVRNLIGGIKTYKAATAEVKLPGTGESEEDKVRCACNAPATDGSEHSKRYVWMPAACNVRDLY